MEPTNFNRLLEIDGYLRPQEHEIRRRYVQKVFKKKFN